jgi:hypothetical protein
MLLSLIAIPRHLRLRTMLTAWALLEGQTDENILSNPQPKNILTTISYDKPICAKLFRWISGHSFHRYHNYLTHQPYSMTQPAKHVDKAMKKPTIYLPSAQASPKVE